MKTTAEQIIVRSKLIGELKQNRIKGLWLGNRLLVSSVVIEGEISRRALLSVHSFYLNQLYK